MDAEEQRVQNHHENAHGVEMCSTDVAVEEVNIFCQITVPNRNSCKEMCAFSHLSVADN